MMVVLDQWFCKKIAQMVLPQINYSSLEWLSYTETLFLNPERGGFKN
jgi:hypothetical protein